MSISCQPPNEFPFKSLKQQNEMGNRITFHRTPAQNSLKHVLSQM